MYQVLDQGDADPAPPAAEIRREIPQGAREIRMLGTMARNEFRLEPGAIHQTLFQRKVVPHVVVQFRQYGIGGGWIVSPLIVSERIDEFNEMAMLLVDFGNADGEFLTPRNGLHGGYLIKDTSITVAECPDCAFRTPPETHNAGV